MNPLERIRAGAAHQVAHLRARQNLLRRRRVTSHRARRRKGSRRRRVVRTLLLIVAALSFMSMSGVAVAWAAYNNYVSQLPDAQGVATNEPPLDSHVYAADGVGDRFVQGQYFLAIH